MSEIGNQLLYTMTMCNLDFDKVFKTDFDYYYYYYYEEKDLLMQVLLDIIVSMILLNFDR